MRRLILIILGLLSFSFCRKQVAQVDNESSFSKYTLIKLITDYQEIKYLNSSLELDSIALFGEGFYAAYAMIEIVVEENICMQVQKEFLRSPIISSVRKKTRTITGRETWDQEMHHNGQFELRCFENGLKDTIFLPISEDYFTQDSIEIDFIFTDSNKKLKIDSWKLKSLTE